MNTFKFILLINIQSFMGVYYKEQISVKKGRIRGYFRIRPYHRSKRSRVQRFTRLRRGSGFHFCPPDSTLEADCLMTTPFFSLPHENQASMGTYFSEDSLLPQVLGSSMLSLSPTLNVEPGTCEPLPMGDGVFLQVTSSRPCLRPYRPCLRPCRPAYLPSLSASPRSSPLWSAAGLPRKRHSEGQTGLPWWDR